MTHPHSDQRTIDHHAPVLAPHIDLVNASVIPLDVYTSAQLSNHPQRGKSSGPLVVVARVAQKRNNTDTLEASVTQPKRSLLRRAIDDPYWILMTLLVTTVATFTALVIYGIVQITQAVATWLSLNGATIVGIIILPIMLTIGAGATVVKCAGIHCYGCKR